MKIQHKIVASSSLLLLITIGCMTIQHYFTVKNEMTSQYVNSIDEIVESITNNTSEMLRNKQSIASYSVSLIEEDLSQDAIKNILRQPEIVKVFNIAGVSFEDGSYILSDSKMVLSKSWDPRTRPWYRLAKKENKMVITEPYLNTRTDDLVASIAAPIRQHGHFVGVAFFDINLSRLTEVINNVDLFGAGYVFIVSSTGQTVAHPQSQLIGHPMSEFLGEVHIKENMRQVILDDVNHMLDFSKIENHDWYVGAILNEEIAYQPVRAILSRSLWVAVLAVIVTMGCLMVVLRALMKPLYRVNDAIKNVASGEGDLTQRLPTDTDQEFAELANNFNFFTVDLQKRIQDTQQIVKDVLNGARISSENSEKTEEFIHSQLIELEQLATAMNQMTSTAQDVASNAQIAATSAREAKQAAEHGSSVVVLTTNSIDELSNRIDSAVKEVQQLAIAANNIESILKVISDISDQTNLLALNAAIEAARAGESGRGFAVVADEVRSLAQRTQHSTLEIQDMISQLLSGSSAVSDAMRLSKVTAESAVKHAHEADAEIKRIQGSIMQINDMNNQIAAAAEEQSSVAEEINNNTYRIKDLSSQIVAGSQDVRTAMKSQMESIHQQEDILSKFKV
ncbi:methyl-accepting chemotaxis protein [Vibrio fluvialis]|nr:methyl-accepting chemotaxis protein [Vibrio fluvialis]